MALPSYRDLLTAVASGDLATLRRVAASPDVGDRLQLALQPELPEPIIEEICELESSALAAMISPTAPDGHAALAIAEVDAAAHSLVLCIALARLPAATPEGLAALAGDTHKEVRAAVAAHPAAERDVLWDLLRGGPGEVWLALAENPALPGDFAARLVDGKWEYEDAIDYTPAVRERLARNPSTPPSVLASLAIKARACDEDLTALAANPNTPDSTLEALACGADRFVAAAATEELTVRWRSSA